MNPEICFAGILDDDTHDALCERLAQALESKHSGLVFARSDETAAALALLLAEGVVIHYQCAGPMGRDQARAWADLVRASFAVASNATH